LSAEMMLRFCSSARIFRSAALALPATA